jgi:hypothetical protein
VNKKNRLVNIAFALASSALAALLTIVLASELGWANFVAWMIFFVALPSPFMMSSRYVYAECTG